MEKLSTIVESVLAHPDLPPENAEQRKARRLILGELFAASDCEDTVRLKSYVRWTQEIPIDKLAIGVVSIIRSRQWPGVPRVAEIWEAARCAAGMNRSQYLAGHHQALPSNWPPFGRRHGAHRGEFDMVRVALKELPETITPQLLAGFNRRRGEGDDDGRSDADQA